MKYGSPIPSRPRTANNGGTTAPRSAAGGLGIYNNRPVYRTGLGQGHKATKPVVPAPGSGPGNPAVPTPAVMPWNSAQQSSEAAARAKYFNALDTLGYNRTAVQQEYGLDPGFNDYQSNPYSRAALLERSYQRSNRGSMNSLGSGGHLYSGSLQNAMGYNRSAREEESSALNSAYQNALQNLREKEIGAGNELNESIAGAGWKALEAAEKQPLEPATATGGKKGKPKKPNKPPQIGVGKGHKAR